MEDIDCAFTKSSTSEDNTVPTPISVPTSVTTSSPPYLPQSARESNKGITLSGLLNALDGVASGEGRLLFCTTNWKERIDPALSRPGRCDIWIEFKHATKTQAKDLFKYFYDSRIQSTPIDPTLQVDNEQKKTLDETEVERIDPIDLNALAMRFASHIPENTISVSALQGFLMRYKRQPQIAVANVEKWVSSGCGQGPTPLLHDGRVEMMDMGKSKGEDRI
ncbi:uncharacterized protein IL334_005714 [Kwoniella shivajii]|uniref:ATPase AAA-type core domain-containing protein n=1 Tax=Kwoniella shivajii TaxID=564305 RepID=A0ABZ1D603_9TREE|nr:hypothetical protein IL334_005714 [Kwoniella shivajii]